MTIKKSETLGLSFVNTTPAGQPIPWPTKDLYDDRSLSNDLTAILWSGRIAEAEILVKLANKFILYTDAVCVRQPNIIIYN